MIEIQNEAFQTQEDKQAKKRTKRTLPEPQSDDDPSGDDVAMQVDFDLGAEGEKNDSDVGEKLVPMPETNGIEALRNKLHIRMAEMRNKGRPAPTKGEPGDRDELLEERRRQRAAMRERRRKETKERIKRAEEMKGKKNKDSREERKKGNSTKVRQKHDSRIFSPALTILFYATDSITRARSDNFPTQWSSIQNDERNLREHRRTILQKV